MCRTSASGEGLMPAAQRPDPPSSSAPRSNVSSAGVLEPDAPTPPAPRSRCSRKPSWSKPGLPKPAGIRSTMQACKPCAPAGQFGVANALVANTAVTATPVSPEYLIVFVDTSPSSCGGKTRANLQAYDLQADWYLIVGWHSGNCKEYRRSLSFGRRSFAGAPKPFTPRKPLKITDVRIRVMHHGVDTIPCCAGKAW